jgi:predicted O-methyltransferase YrrM
MKAREVRRASGKARYNVAPGGGPTLDEVRTFATEYSLRSDGRPDWLKSIDRDPTSVYYRFFYEFTRAFRPRSIFEIGTCEGLSAAHLAAGNPDGTVITLDIKPEAKRLADALLIPNLVSIVCHSVDAPKRLKWIPPIDLLFVDGNHAFDDAYGEYVAYRPLVRDGGLIFFDDISINDDMQRLWNAVSDPKAILDGLHYTGFGVAEKRSHTSQAPPGVELLSSENSSSRARSRL